jgi:hypothetical protein
VVAAPTVVRVHTDGATILCMCTCFYVVNFMQHLLISVIQGCALTIMTANSFWASNLCMGLDALSLSDMAWGHGLEQHT